MTAQIILVLVFNFITSIIGTLAYAVRLVGVRTGKIAVSYAVFNILSLVSRVAVTFQTPLMSKIMEVNSDTASITNLFYLIILASGIATVAGAFLIPTFQRAFSKVVLSFSENRSVPRILMRSLSKEGMRQLRDCTAVPVKENLTQLHWRNLPKKILLYNLVAVAILTVGSIAPILAGAYEPDLRATCITLSSVINGTATILMTVFIDPYLSMMTDDLVAGKVDEEAFRACVIGMVGTKTAGTFASLLLLVPSAQLVAFIARIL